MMFFLSFCIFIFSVHFTLCDNFCMRQTPCQCVTHNGFIDLTSVGLPNLPRFHDIHFHENNCTSFDLYSYNPCFPFSYDTEDIKPKPGHEACTEAAACIKTPGGINGEPPEEYTIGLQHTAVFGSDINGSYITYTAPGGTGAQKSLKVYLTCDKSVEHELAKITPDCTEDLDYMESSIIVLNLTSKCCCVNGCPPALEPDSKDLSTGSVLLIVFFTVLFAYLVVGVVWNFCNGAHGAELIPNIELWNELPTLIMEGVIFTCSCFRGRTYGEIGSSDVL